MCPIFLCELCVLVAFIRSLSHCFNRLLLSNKTKMCCYSETVCGRVYWLTFGCFHKALTVIYSSRIPHWKKFPHPSFAPFPPQQTKKTSDWVAQDKKMFARLFMNFATRRKSTLVAIDPNLVQGHKNIENIVSLHPSVCRYLIFIHFYFIFFHFLRSSKTSEKQKRKKNMTRDRADAGWFIDE